MPNKIKYRDLSPELQAIISGEVGSEEALEKILELYSKKTDIISEQNIDPEYRQKIDARIEQIKTELKSLSDSLLVVGEDKLSTEFLQKIETLTNEVNTLTEERQVTANQLQVLDTAINALKVQLESSDVALVDKRVDATNAVIDKIQQRLIELDSVNENLAQEINKFDIALDRKRGKDDIILKNDLEDDLITAITNGSTAFENLQNLIPKINMFPDIAKGEYLGTNDEYGNIHGKSIFTLARVIETDSALDTIAPRAKDPVISLSTGNYYSAEKVIIENPDENVEAEDQYQYIYSIDYLKNNPLFWNTFLVDVDSNEIKALILTDGKLVKVGGEDGGYSPVTIEIPLAKDSERTIERPDALKRNPVTILAKDTDPLSGTYNKYISAEHVINISYSKNSYTLYNMSDEDLELIIRG